MGDDVANVDAPDTHGFASHADTRSLEEVLTSPLAGREPMVEPDRMSDDLEREPVTGTLLTAQHRATRPKRLATTIVADVVNGCRRDGLRFRPPLSSACRRTSQRSRTVSRSLWRPRPDRYVTTARLRPVIDDQRPRGPGHDCGERALRALKDVR